jgi:uracil-DNA glycosylase
MTASRQRRLQLLVEHQQELLACRRCPGMIPPVVSCGPVLGDVMLLGQAPGSREGKLGRPFAWTAGRTMFGWFEGLGIDEARFRKRVYMAAVCRCFPGSLTGGGDRVPNRREIEACEEWMRRDFELLRPKLVIAVGRLAISRFLSFKRLTEVVGRQHCAECFGQRFDLIPLPHPSGASTWHRTEPGRTLLGRALSQLGEHPAFGRVVRPP